MEEDLKSTDFHYYSVPVIREKRRDKYVVYIIEYGQRQTYYFEQMFQAHWQSELQAIAKEQGIPYKHTKTHDSMYISFTEHFKSRTHYRINEKLVKLVEPFYCSQTVLDEYLKIFIEFCKEKYGTSRRLDIEVERLEEWSQFVRFRALSGILTQKVIPICRDKDIHIVLLMEAKDLINSLPFDLSNEFTKRNSRCKLHYVCTGEFDRRINLKFASELQNCVPNVKTNRICHFFDEYNQCGFEKRNEIIEYSYYNDVATTIARTDLVFNSYIEIDLPLLQDLPWGEKTSKLKQGTIMMTREDIGDIIPVKHNLKGYFVTKIPEMDADALVNLFSSWVNTIMEEYNYLQGSKSDIQDCAGFLEKFLKNSLPYFKLNLIPDNKSIENMTVRQRLIAQAANRFYYKICFYINSLKDMIRMDTVDELSKEEKLQRLSIGTEIGKYHQRALVMRGMSVLDFNGMKDFFVEALKKHRDTLSPESDQDRSLFSLENQKDVFLQDDIFDALSEIKNQYDLISAFPLIGIGVKLQRSNGSMINPYLVKVIDIAKVNANVDTVSIQNTPDKELNLNAGFYIGADFGGKTYQVQKYGFKELKWTMHIPKKAVIDELEQTQLFYYKSEQLKEQIDAVVPLFGKKDYDLRPLLSTQFFHVLMTFNVMHNADTCYSEAYLALLANTLIYLINTPQSTHRDELLDKIYHSTNIVYGERPFFKIYCENLIANPRLAMVTFHEGHPTQCQDPSKALLILFFLVKDGKLDDKDKIKEILEAIMQEIVARNTKKLEKLHQFFGIVNYEGRDLDKIEQDLIHNVIGDVLQYPTVRSMMKKIETSFVERKYFDFTKACKIYLNKSEFGFMNYGKMNFFTSMRAICAYFLPGEKFNGALLWIWLLHAQRFPNNFTRNSSPMITSMQKVYSNLKNQKIIHFVKEEKGNIFRTCYQILQYNFQQQMIRLHIFAFPETTDSFTKKFEKEKAEFEAKEESLKKEKELEKAIAGTAEKGVEVVEEEEEKKEIEVPKEEEGVVETVEAEVAAKTTTPLLHEPKKFVIKFNNVSNLSKNSCQSPKCPFYLKHVSNVQEHLRDIDCSIPGFHKTVKLMFNREPEAILKSIGEGNFLDDTNMIEYVKRNSRLQSFHVQHTLLHKNRELYLDLIRELIPVYRNINRGKY